MNGKKVLGATLTAKLAVDTVAGLDPYGGEVFLPPPSQYLATWTLWFILGLIAEVGPRASRAAGQFSALVLLAAMVLGPFGRKAVAFLNATSGFFPTVTAPPYPTETAGGTGAQPLQPTS